MDLEKRKETLQQRIREKGSEVFGAAGITLFFTFVGGGALLAGDTAKPPSHAHAPIQKPAETVVTESKAGSDFEKAVNYSSLAILALFAGVPLRHSISAHKSKKEYEKELADLDATSGAPPGAKGPDHPHPV